MLTSYKTPNVMTIEDKYKIKDLEVVMASAAVFETHIGQVVRKCRLQMGWVLRTFNCRDNYALSYPYFTST